MLYGTMNNGHGGQDEPAAFIRIFGHGTLSGDKLPHPNFAEPPIEDDQNWLYHPLDIEGLNRKQDNSPVAQKTPQVISNYQGCFLSNWTLVQN